MPTPKSVIKVKKMGIEYISEVDKAQYYIFELCRAALRDSAKVVLKSFRENYYSHFKRRTGNAGKALKAKVYSSKNTQFPRVEIGLKPKTKGYYAMLQEFGTKGTRRTKKSGKVSVKPIPKLGLLQKSVKDNIDTIQSVQAKYLSAIDVGDEACEALIDESEVEVAE